MTTTQEALPTRLSHCIKVYNRMREEADQIEADGAVPIVVWEGFTTALVRDLKLAVPYYTMVKNCLEEMGCIKQLRRGGGASKSQWELLQPPTLELWKALPNDVTGTNSSRSTNAVANEASMRALQQVVQDMNKRINDLENNIQMLVELFNKQLPQQRTKTAKG